MGAHRARGQKRMWARGAVWAASCWMLACPQAHSAGVPAAFAGAAPSFMPGLFVASRPLRATSDAPHKYRNACAGRTCRGMAAGGRSELDKLNDLKAQLEQAVAQEKYAEAARLRDEIQAKSRCGCAALCGLWVLVRAPQWLSARPVRSDASLGVLGANAEFYRAFREGDVPGMDTVWGDEEDGMRVACAHPAMPLVRSCARQNILPCRHRPLPTCNARLTACADAAAQITGRDKVLDSWKSILGSGSPPNIRPENAQLVVADETAWVMNEEVIDHGPGQPSSKCMATNIFVKRCVCVCARVRACARAQRWQSEVGARAACCGHILRPLLKPAHPAPSLEAPRLHRTHGSSLFIFCVEQ